ncbi:GGDEF domain-containing protein [Devosia sp. Root413D1]|uniref:GGDEF domain-containing protein n=1 Tax=Devosia sp. Root413D1 TaxID=1736531 RepID=UPI0009E79C48|nr:GGDEF domain-containing protein [Devosia sp. Root413D1]
MAQRSAGTVGSAAGADAIAMAADLDLPNPRRLLIISIVAIVLLGLSVVIAAGYSVLSINETAISAETERAQVALAVLLQDGQPDAAGATRLARDFVLKGARFGEAAGMQPGEVAIAVPGSETRLMWTPRRIGTELAQHLAPIRLLASALFLGGIGIVLNRLYRLARLLEARRRAAQDLAARDALTGLHNRLGFDQRLGQTTDGPALLYLDLDGFKHVNDSFGHGAGDDLLRIVADRLRGLARDGDCVARIGGDEFAFLRSPPTSRAELAELAADIGVALSEPVRLGATQIQIGASIGIAMGSEHGDDRARLVAAADAALYRAKALPGHAFVFADSPIISAAA